MSKPKNDDQTRTHFLATITNVHARILEYEVQQRLLVMAALKEGATWREVGEALGVSGQAAWSKYRPDHSQKINGL